MSTRQDVATGTADTDLQARAPGYLAGGVVRLVDPSEMEGRTLRATSRSTTFP